MRRGAGQEAAPTPRCRHQARVHAATTLGASCHGRQRLRPQPPHMPQCTEQHQVSPPARLWSQLGMQKPCNNLNVSNPHSTRMQRLGRFPCTPRTKQHQAVASDEVEPASARLGGEQEGKLVLIGIVEVLDLRLTR